MSVVIYGMQKPKYCINCPLAKNCIVGNGAPMGTEAPEVCPIKDIPEKHGRLIDVDKLKADYGMKDDCADCDKELRNKSKSCEYDRIYSKMDFCGWLDDATVVIEAEGAEE